MNNRKLLASVCAVALAGALPILPAHGSENESDGEAAESTEDIAEEEFQFLSPSTKASYSVSGTDFFGANGLVETAPRIELRSAAPIQSVFDLNTSPIRRAFDATPIGPNPEIIARDDVGIDGSIDVENTQPSVVQLFLQDNTTGGVFFNCTVRGLIIVPASSTTT